VLIDAVLMSCNQILPKNQCNSFEERIQYFILLFNQWLACCSSRIIITYDNTAKEIPSISKEIEYVVKEGSPSEKFSVVNLQRNSHSNRQN
jgi:hypothetical protein